MFPVALVGSRPCSTPKYTGPSILRQNYTSPKYFPQTCNITGLVEFLIFFLHSGVCPLMQTMAAYRDVSAASGLKCHATMSTLWEKNGTLHYSLSCGHMRKNNILYVVGYHTQTPAPTCILLSHVIIISLVGAGVWRVLMPFPAMTRGKCAAAAGGWFFGLTTSAANRCSPFTFLWIVPLEASIVFCCIWARV